MIVQHKITLEIKEKLTSSAIAYPLYAWLLSHVSKETGDALHEQGIQSLLVEGGAQTIQSFIDRGLWDEAREELSTRLLGCGVPVPKMPVGVVRRSEQTFGVTVNHWTNFEGTL